jgi:hypothetical protein
MVLWRLMEPRGPCADLWCAPVRQRLLPRGRAIQFFRALGWRLRGVPIESFWTAMADDELCQADAGR